jgi:heme-degrading monooxygenase HmoA
MLLAVFRTRVRPEAVKEYQSALERMWKIAKDQPGFISAKTYFSNEGDEVVIQEWESPEHLRAWRDHPDHVEARRRGREEFYQDYTIYVCDEPRKYEFSR